MQKCICPKLVRLYWQVPANTIILCRQKAPITMHRNKKAILLDKLLRRQGLLLLFVCGCITGHGQPQPRRISSFDDGWVFRLGDDSLASMPAFHDNGGQRIEIPHDWSIAGTFSASANTTTQEAALPAGIGWYRKHF